VHIIEKIQNQSEVADGDLIQFSPFFFWEQGLNYSPLGALGAKAIEAAIMAKRVTIWKVFMVLFRWVLIDK